MPSPLPLRWLVITLAAAGFYGTAVICAHLFSGPLPPVDLNSFILATLVVGVILSGVDLLNRASARRVQHHFDRLLEVMHAENRGAIVEITLHNREMAQLLLAVRTEASTALEALRREHSAELKALGETLGRQVEDLAKTHARDLVALHSRIDDVEEVSTAPGRPIDIEVVRLEAVRGREVEGKNGNHPRS